MKKLHLWHGSKDPVLDFGGSDKPDVLHLGSFDQAAMRYPNGYFHLMAVDLDKVGRIKDSGSDKRSAITRARRAGKDAIVYLNRYEGISVTSLEDALAEFTNEQIDKMSDAKFRIVFPEAHDSCIILNLPDGAGRCADGGKPVFTELGCYKGRRNAEAGYTEKVKLAGNDRHPAAELPFNKWIGHSHPNVLREECFGASERRWIEDCEDALVIANLRLDFDAPDIPGLACAHLYEENGLKFISAPNALLVRDAGTEALLGGIARGVVTVFPEFRGRGIAQALHICAEETRCINLKPTHFSEGGYASRKSAHRALCQRALERGDRVAPVNRDAYHLQKPAPEVEPQF
jgi:GNAT superfamily N-acetyltransferase